MSTCGFVFRSRAVSILCCVCVSLIERHEVAVTVKAEALPGRALPDPSMHLLVASVAQAHEVVRVGRYVRIIDVRRTQLLDVVHHDRRRYVPALQAVLA